MLLAFNYFCIKISSESFDRVLSKSLFGSLRFPSVIGSKHDFHTLFAQLLFNEGPRCFSVIVFISVKLSQSANYGKEKI